VGVVVRGDSLVSCTRAAVSRSRVPSGELTNLRCDIPGAADLAVEVLRALRPRVLVRHCFLFVSLGRRVRGRPLALSF
jgi:hypothetical protein